MVSLWARPWPLLANLSVSILFWGVSVAIRSSYSGDPWDKSSWRFVQERVLASYSFSKPSSGKLLYSSDGFVEWVNVEAVVPQGLRGSLMIQIDGDAPGSVFFDDVIITNITHAG